MNITIVVSNNLMDASKVREAARFINHDVIVFNSSSRVKQLFLAGPGDRRFLIILDYQMFDMDGFGKTLDELHKIALQNDIFGIKVAAFAPHVQIDTLKVKYPQVSFISRSVFFKDLTRHLEIKESTDSK